MASQTPDANFPVTSASPRVSGRRRTALPSMASQRMNPAPAQDQGPSPHATQAMTPVLATPGLSIRAKVILPMALLSALLVAIVGAVLMARTHALMESEMDRSGAGYAQYTRAIGELYSISLGERKLLSTLQARAEDVRLFSRMQPWRDLQAYFGYGDGSKLDYHPASATTIEELKADLQWVYVANLLETAKASEEARVAILGPQWATSRGARFSSPRRLARSDFSEAWPAATAGISYATLQSRLDAPEVDQRLRGVLGALMQLQRDATLRTFGGIVSGGSFKGQFAGVSYRPSNSTLGYAALGDPAALAALTEEARVQAGIQKMQVTNANLNSGLVNTSVSEGVGPDGTALRQYVLQPTPGEEVQVFLNVEQIAQASSDAMLNIVLILAGSLVLSIVVAVLVGNGLTNPIRALAKDVSLIASGNFEHRPSVHTRDEVGTLAQLVSDMAVKLSIGRETWLENQARKHDIDLAKEIQDSLLPATVPVLPGYDISAYYSPSKEVGGDYYDFVKIDEHHLGIICADVSGKGIPAGMVMMMVKALINSEARRTTSPKQVLANVNRILARDIKRGMFVTAFYMVLDTRQRLLRVASAGHNPLYLLRGSEKKLAKVNPGGIALGFDREGKLFEKNLQEQSLVLQPGDRLIVYTDGITEAMSPDGREFGEEGLKQVLSASRERTSEDFLIHLVEAVHQFAQTHVQRDDITAVTIRLTTDA